LNGKRFANGMTTATDSATDAEYIDAVEHFFWRSTRGKKIFYINSRINFV
jgi:hypothetical protein